MRFADEWATLNNHTFPGIASSSTSSTVGVAERTALLYVLLYRGQQAELQTHDRMAHEISALLSMSPRPLRSPTKSSS